MDTPQFRHSPSVAMDFDSDGANSDSETSRTRGALEHVSAKQSQEPAPENVRSKKRKRFPRDQKRGNSDSKTCSSHGF